MPKIKTRKSLLKRLKITKTGKVLKKNVRLGHLNSKLSDAARRRKNTFRQQTNSGHLKLFKQLIPNSGIKLNPEK
ncbi:MAG: 50S ribosomal protein L35 [Patescibacteria group bacterium]|uniref:Large ribosomal subunit protein bL35 n=1 Tax=candidate division WWE3 bacterium TaxID=2053526 RepID=A0A955EBR4_UNCKA|nr:50S ribosomal protein L35 [candidate division WWE3 bacterium]